MLLMYIKSKTANKLFCNYHSNSTNNVLLLFDIIKLNDFDVGNDR